MMKKLIIILAIILFLVLAFLVFQSKESFKEIVPPEATGKVDDLNKSLTQELVDTEETLLDDFEVDLIISDEELLNNFGESINENEL